LRPNRHLLKIIRRLKGLPTTVSDLKSLFSVRSVLAYENSRSGCIDSSTAFTDKVDFAIIDVERGRVGILARFEYIELGNVEKIAKTCNGLATSQCFVC
jgi:hypothetical protein